MNQDDKELLHGWRLFFVAHWKHSPIRWTGNLILLLFGLWVLIGNFLKVLY